MSAFTDAIARLAGNFYNSLSKTSGNPGGMGNDGHQTNFPLAINDVALVSAEAAAAAVTAQAAAATAVAAPGTLATSASTVDMPELGEAFTIRLDQTGKLFDEGMSVTISSDDDPTEQAVGPITVFDPDTRWMTILTKFVNGTGSKTGFRIAISPPVDATLTGRVTTLEQLAIKQRRRRTFFTQEL